MPSFVFFFPSSSVGLVGFFFLFFFYFSRNSGPLLKISGHLQQSPNTITRLIKG